MANLLITNINDYTYRVSSTILGSTATVSSQGFTVTCAQSKGGCAICDVPRELKNEESVFWSLRVNSNTFAVGLVNHTHNLENGDLGSTSCVGTSIALVKYFDTSGNATLKVRGLGIDEVISAGNIEIGDIITIELLLQNKTSSYPNTVAFYKNGKPFTSKYTINSIFTRTYDGVVQPCLAFPAVGNPNPNQISSCKYDVNFGNNTGSYFSGIPVPPNCVSYNVNNANNVFVYPTFYVNTDSPSVQSSPDGLTPQTACKKIYDVINKAGQDTLKYGARILISPKDTAYTFAKSGADLNASSSFSKCLQNYNWQIESSSETYMVKISVLETGSGIFPSLTNTWNHLVIIKCSLNNFYGFETVVEGSGIFTLDQCELIVKVTQYGKIDVRRSRNVSISNCYFSGFKSYITGNNDLSILLGGARPYGKTTTVYNCSFMESTGVGAGLSGTSVVIGTYLDFKNSLIGYNVNSPSFNVEENTTSIKLLEPHDSLKQYTVGDITYGAFYKVLEIIQPQSLTMNINKIQSYSKV